MPHEHDDLITQAKDAPDIETALECVLLALANRWKMVSDRNDYGKGLAMAGHLNEDLNTTMLAILGHHRVFKEPVKVEPSREEQLPDTPKTTDQSDGQSYQKYRGYQELRLEKFDRDGKPVRALPIKPVPDEDLDPVPAPILSRDLGIQPAPARTVVPDRSEWETNPSKDRV